MGLIETSEPIRVDTTGPNPQQLKISILPLTFFKIELLPVKQILSEHFPYPIVIYNDISAAGMLSLTNLLSPEAFILCYNSYYIPHKYIKQMEQKIYATKFLKGNTKIKVFTKLFDLKCAIFKVDFGEEKFIRLSPMNFDEPKNT